MRFTEVSDYGEKQFVRLTGVKREVFEIMVEVILQSSKSFGQYRTLSDNKDANNLLLAKSLLYVLLLLFITENLHDILAYFPEAMSARI